MTGLEDRLRPLWGEDLRGEAMFWHLGALWLPPVHPMRHRYDRVRRVPRRG